MTAALDRLRAGVKAWYWEEAERTAASFESTGDLAAVDFSDAQRACPHGVQLTQHMRRAAELFCG